MEVAMQTHTCCSSRHGALPWLAAPVLSTVRHCDAPLAVVHLSAEVSGSATDILLVVRVPEGALRLYVSQSAAAPCTP